MAAAAALKIEVQEKVSDKDPAPYERTPAVLPEQA